MPLESVELRPPRVEVPELLAEIAAVDTYSRASHALGKAYRDVVRGFRGPVRRASGRGDAPPRRARARAGARVGVLGRRRGDPLRRRHERRRRHRAARARPRGLARREGARPRARDRPRLARGEDPGGRDRPGARGPAARARAHAQALPAVVRVLDPRRLDRHPRRRPLRHAADAHRRPGRVGARPDAGRLVGEPPPAGVRRGPEPGPAADRLGGHARRDHRGVDARSGPAALEGERGRPVRHVRAGRRGGARARPVRACGRRTAGCSTRPRAR